MEYLFSEVDYYGIKRTVCITNDHINFSSTDAQIDNYQYIRFLAAAGLTDEKAQELETDVWYSFPETDKEK